MQIFDKDQWNEIWHVIKENKFRSILTAFGIFWGILMIVVMLGAGKGFESGVKQGMGSMATNSGFMWSQSTSMPHKGYQKGRRVKITNSDVDFIKRTVKELEYISPRLRLGGYRGANNVQRGLKVAAYTVSGDYPVQDKINPVRLIKGRLINQSDIDHKRKVCIVGIGVEDELFEVGETPINEQIQINGVYFTVIGVFRSYATGEQAEEDEKSISLPFTTFQKVFNAGDEVHWLAITALPNERVSTVTDNIKNILKTKHNVHPEDDRAFGDFNVQERYERISLLFIGITVISFFVGTLTLIAGIIGVINIMLIVINERTKEIGIRRSIGASPWKVREQIILETLVITVFSGMLGVIGGVWIIEGLNFLIENFGSEDGAFKNPSISSFRTVGVFLTLVVFGMIAGLIASNKAVKIKPIEALRQE